MPKASKFNSKKRITVRDHHVNNTPRNFGKSAHYISACLDGNIEDLIEILENYHEVESGYMTRSYRHAAEHALKELGLDVEVLKHNKIKVKSSKEKVAEARKKQLEWVEKWNNAEDKYQLLKDTFSKKNQ